MWDIYNRTPFEADRNWVRDKEGRHHFVTAIKATFDIHPSGTLEPASPQVPPLLGPEYFGDPGSSSLRWDSDLGPAKPGTDIVVHGHACAPDEKPIPELPVSLRAGDFEKVLTVRGENVFHRGAGLLATTSPRPFVRMPVVYERAYGGTDTRDPNPLNHRQYDANPVGVGFATRSAHLDNTPGPNVVYPGKNVDSGGPAGFGPIATFWAPRRKLGGTYDASWVEHRKPLLPSDYDPRHELSAPPDQRWLDAIPPGLPIKLINMTPDRVLHFEVPSLSFRATACFGRREVGVAPRLCSVLIDADLRQVMFVWQAILLVPRMDVEYLDGVRIETA